MRTKSERSRKPSLPQTEHLLRPALPQTDHLLRPGKAELGWAQLICVKGSVPLVIF